VKRTILIGDVHGCLEELERLLRACAVTAADEVVLVGDLVAKGPDSLGVIRLVRERGFRAVLGNHDAAVLRLRHPDPDRPVKGEHRAIGERLDEGAWRWLEELPLTIALLEHGVRVVHGGLVPGVALEKQKREHLLNLRSITPAGEPSKRVDDGTAWASLWRGPEHIVFGHDAIRGLQQHPFATGLDTGCVYGRRLTALVLPERRLVGVEAARAYAKTRDE
jgi:predicted phosphodiesterase